jgi:hypothetical protein
MIFIGDDWAEDHHDVHVIGEAGQRLDWQPPPEGLAGIREFHELIATHAEESGQVMIGIDTDRAACGWARCPPPAIRCLPSIRWQWPAIAIENGERQ